MGLAFAAGLIAALNPCGFAMLPAYLALVVRGEQRSQVRAVGRALGATVAMAVGFVVVFTTFGLLTVALASTVQSYLPFVTVVIGIVLVALGIWLVLGRELSMPSWGSPRWAPTARLGSMFGYGVGYAIASLSCTVGPFLAITGAGLPGASVREALPAYLAYAAGITLVVGALAVAAAFASSALADRLHRLLPFINRISGVLLILVGLYVGYYGVYEIRLFRLDGAPQDPVIAAAGRIQGELAGWVFTHGGWPWVVLLGVVLVAALVWAALHTKIISNNPGQQPIATRDYSAGS